MERGGSEVEEDLDEVLKVFDDAEASVEAAVFDSPGCFSISSTGGLFLTVADPSFTTETCLFIMGDRAEGRGAGMDKEPIIDSPFFIGAAFEGSDSEAFGAGGERKDEAEVGSACKPRLGTSLDVAERDSPLFEVVAEEESVLSFVFDGWLFVSELFFATPLRSFILPLSFLLPLPVPLPTAAVPCDEKSIE